MPSTNAYTHTYTHALPQPHNFLLIPLPSHLGLFLLRSCFQRQDLRHATGCVRCPFWDGEIGVWYGGGGGCDCGCEGEEEGDEGEGWDAHFLFWLECVGMVVVGWWEGVGGWIDGLVGGLRNLRWKQVCFSSGYGFVEVSSGFEGIETTVEGTEV